MKRGRKGSRSQPVGGGQAELDFRSDPVGSEGGEGLVGALPTLKSVPLKFLSTKIGSGKTPSGGSQAYVEDGIIFLRSQNVHFDGLRLEDVAYITEETDAEMASTRIKSLDVVLNITGASIGRCSLIPDGFPPANVNQHVCIVRTEKAKLRPAYLNFVLQSVEIQNAIFSGENGSSREGLTFEQIGNFSVVSPPVESQDAIAAYLDRETGRMDGLIRAKEGLLGLLAEKRRALIARAVTRGLDPAAPLRDSGIPWLGAVPEHWETRRLAFLFQERDERGQPDLPILEVSINRGVALREFTGEKIESTAADLGTMKVAREGDIVFNKMRMWQGAVGLSPCDGLTSPDYVVATPISDHLHPDFVRELFRTPAFSAECARHSNGLTWDRMRLYWEGFRDIVIPIPPHAEQRAIVAHVAAETTELDALRASAERTIRLLKERRAALISAAVTGRIEIPT